MDKCINCRRKLEIIVPDPNSKEALAAKNTPLTPDMCYDHIQAVLSFYLPHCAYCKHPLDTSIVKKVYQIKKGE